MLDIGVSPGLRLVNANPVSVMTRWWRGFGWGTAVPERLQAVMPPTSSGVRLVESLLSSKRQREREIEMTPANLAEQAFILLDADVHHDEQHHLDAHEE